MVHSNSAASEAMQSTEVETVTQGESEDEAAIVWLEAGTYTMGLIPEDHDSPGIFDLDREGPPREVRVDSFGLGKFEVSNRRFKKFVDETGYVTESESFGWSFAVEALVSAEVNASSESQVVNAPWWIHVVGADWRHPNGPDTSVDDKLDHPVTQVSFKDAQSFCRWSRRGGRLPTEEEWEYAARGGKHQRRYPWGNKMLTGKDSSTHRMNIWQGEMDERLQKSGKVVNLYSFGEHSLAMVKEYYGQTNLALDGYVATAPVDAYGPQNGFGFHNLVGNVWEWTSTKFVGPGVDETAMVKKGGSFLCNPSTCNRFRNSARMMFTADSAASNVGFRCAYNTLEASSSSSLSSSAEKGSSG